jgi:electron transport complex protein RnfC
MGLATFSRGIHPPEMKELSSGSPLKPAKQPSTAIIPLSQHIGAPCTSTVDIGQVVLAGQQIGSAGGFVSAPIHASISGKVSAISAFPMANGRVAPCIVIENNNLNQSVDFEPNKDFMSLSPEDLKKKITAAGIVGMGGATFPTHVKLSPPKEKPIDAVLINGAECEPYLTADHRQMVERASDVISGLKILMKVLGVKNGYVGIENNKPDAIVKMTEAVRSEPSIKIITLEVKYPQGAEKMLIKAILDREVPAGGLPMDIGVVAQNVGTATAIYEACAEGKPLIERVVSITGNGIKNPSNLVVKIGTTFSQLIDECGGFNKNVVKVISGGPMMGFAVFSLDAPVTKGTSGIVIMADNQGDVTEKHGPCIRCGRCIEACPMGLIPSMLSIYSERSMFEGAKDYRLFDCFECGSCTYVCPAKRPIVQFIRLAKSLVKP